MQRPWGVETILGVVSGFYSFKRLHLNAGYKGGLQEHRVKNEMAILISGEMIVRFVDRSGSLNEIRCESGDVVHFPPGLIHQEEAITDCVIIEASTPHFNDRIRREQQFGLLEDGLPTTAVEDIVFK
jgi:mannose-6-phosphate isomerase-like protein (cupin superfamily)